MLGSVVISARLFSESRTGDGALACLQSYIPVSPFPKATPLVHKAQRFTRCLYPADYLSLAAIPMSTESSYLGKPEKCIAVVGSSALGRSRLLAIRRNWYHLADRCVCPHSRPVHNCWRASEQWSKPKVIAPLIVGICCIPVWIWWEKKATHAMVPFIVSCPLQTTYDVR
jgi:hypothetical protein